MPGGGRVTRVTREIKQAGFNEHGDVAFFTALDTSEEGIYLYSRGSLSLIAKTGTVVPGVGTISSFPTFQGAPDPGAALNDHGQVGFGCTLADGRVVLLVATPQGNESKQHERKGAKRKKHGHGRHH